MAGITGFFRRKKRVVEDGTTSDVTLEQREDIIAMRADGIKPSDIALELDLPALKVCKVLEHDRRRTARLSGSNNGDNGKDRLRELEIELKELSLKRERLQLEWELEDMRAERQADISDMPHDDVSGNMLAQTILTSFLGARQAGTSEHPLAQNPPPQPATTPKQLTEAEIEALLEAAPQDELVKLRKLPDATIKGILRGKMAGYTEGTYDRAVILIKGR